MPKKVHRILTIAHAHPDFSVGGGEIAAYNLYKAYKSLPEVEQSWFLGRVDRGRGANGQIGVRRENEYVWEQGIGDWFTMSASHQESVTTWFVDLLKALQPTIVHAHHYVHLGLEFLQIIRRTLPSVKIVLTLHEYFAICRNNGQMIKTHDSKLCVRSSPDDCRQCFPTHTAEDFWLRECRFKGYFEVVDHFVSPSHFLKDRYVAWGLDPSKIHVIENGQREPTPLTPRPIGADGKRNRFGFFGQINPYKGIDVLLSAMSIMDEAIRKEIVLEVHGSNLEIQPTEFQTKIERLRAPLIEEGCVVWYGAYRSEELESRMRDVDWVLVPSVWWENSPMVIQEAFTYRRPLIVSGIGGMAEKVRNGIDGLHAVANNPTDWSRQLQRATSNSVWSGCYDAIKSPIGYGECARFHLNCI